MFSPTGIAHWEDHDNVYRNDTQNMTDDTQNVTDINYVSSCDESLTPPWSLIAVLLLWLLM